jgi:hypothetical protein
MKHTTTLKASVPLLGLSLLSVFLMAAEPKDKRDIGPESIDISSYPPEIQEIYPLFQSKCSKCHSLARPINATIKGNEWKAYIKKMIRRPASGINEADGEEIFKFLDYYSTVGKPARGQKGKGP